MTVPPVTDSATATTALSADTSTRPRFGWPLTFYLVGAWLLDLQVPVEGINVGNLLLMAGCLAAIATTVWIRYRMRVRGTWLMAHDFAYLAYVAFAVASAAWAPSRLETTVHGLFLAIVWFAAVNLAQGDLNIIVRRVVQIAVGTAILSFAIIPVSPEAAFQPVISTEIPELRGILSHQLRLGLLMAVALGLGVLAILNRERREAIGRRHWVAGAALIVTLCLVAAFARLYTAAMVGALTLTIATSKPGWRRALSVMAMGLGALTVLLMFDLLAKAVVDTGADITLTGRTLLWGRTLAFLGTGEWLGMGYASFNHPTFDHLWPNYRPAHPHNSFIQAYFETGYVGLGLTILLVASHLRIALKVSRATRRYSYSLFLVFLTVLGSLAGSNYAGKPTFLFSLLLLMLSIEARQVQSWRRGRTSHV